MKTKIIFSLLIAISVACFYSFKSPLGDSLTAMMVYETGKNHDDNFVVVYGDGKIEKFPFNPFSVKENHFARTLKIAEITDQLAHKGYHVITTTANGDLIFEKR